MWILNNLDLDEVVRREYMSLSTSWLYACPNWINTSITLDSPKYTTLKREEPFVATAFTENFPGDPVPEIISGPCCSQFAVTRDAIRKVSKEQYASHITWLLGTSLDDDLSGRMWEHWWHYIFLGRTVDCPIEHKALCVGFHICFQDQSSYDDYKKLLKLKGEAEGKRKDMKKAKQVDTHQLNLLNWKIRGLEEQLEDRRDAALAKGKNAGRRQAIARNIY